MYKNRWDGLAFPPDGLTNSAWLMMHSGVDMNSARCRPEDRSFVCPVCKQVPEAMGWEEKGGMLCLWFYCRVCARRKGDERAEKNRKA